MKENSSDTPSIFNTPHDAVVKFCLRDLSIAKSFLDVYLPEEVKLHCDFSTLRVENSSFVEEELKQVHSDVLYSLKFNQKKGYIYALVEHQSSPDKLMPARMVRYQAAILSKHFQEHGSFPTVIPILFYAGRQTPYPYSCDLKEYQENPHLSSEVLLSKYKLIDLTAMPYEALSTHKSVELLELVLKQAWERDLKQAVQYLSERKQGQIECISHEILRRIAEYLLQTSENGDFIEALTNYMQEPYKSDIMTIAQCLEEKGRKEGLELGVQKGRQEGRMEGLEEGRKEEKIHVAKELLAIGTDLAIISKITGLDSETLTKLCLDKPNN